LQRLHSVPLGGRIRHRTGRWDQQFFSAASPAGAVAFAALAILNNARQPYGIRPIVVKDYLETQMPAAQQLFFAHSD